MATQLLDAIFAFNLSRARLHRIRRQISNLSLLKQLLVIWGCSEAAFYLFQRCRYSARCSRLQVVDCITACWDVPSSELHMTPANPSV